MLPEDFFKITKTIQGKRWQVRRVCGREPNYWCWLVNVEKPEDQCRLSLKAWNEYPGYMAFGLTNYQGV